MTYDTSRDTDRNVTQIQPTHKDPTMSDPPINGRTQLVGLIGWPVEHSLSPAMQNAAFEALGLNYRYVPLPVPPGQVDVAVGGLAALGFSGANVTVPHKEAVLRALTRPGHPEAVAADAEALGAVNTLVVHRGTAEHPIITGHNTDAAGFVGSLEAAGTSLKTISAVVVGAGGAARAVIFGLIRAGTRAITILNRRPERAERIVADLKGADVADTRLRAAALEAGRLVEICRTADLLVNATPVGMWPHGEGTIWPAEVPIPSQLTVFDLVYNPPTTRLLQQARASGARAVDGLDMLVRQGALAFEIWTGEDAPVPVMRRACQRALAHGSPQ